MEQLSSLDLSIALKIAKDDIFISPESETGNIEYKYTLQDLNNNTIARANQFYYRLQEGNGIAYLYLGVTDSGYQLGLVASSLHISLANAKKSIELIGAYLSEVVILENEFPVEDHSKQLYLSYNTPADSIEHILIKTGEKAISSLLLSSSPSSDEQMTTASATMTTAAMATAATTASSSSNNAIDNMAAGEFLTTKQLSILWTKAIIADNPSLYEKRYVAKLRFTRKQTLKPEIRVAVLGAADAGKSSLIGVLTSRLLDNGNGSARSTVFTHRHEIETGRTSCVGHRLLGFNEDGQVINHHRLIESDLVHESAKIVKFIDLAGQMKYLKTTIKGICSQFPDRSLIVIDASKKDAITPMTKEHIVISYLRKIPMTIVFTKMDRIFKDTYAHNLTCIKTMMKQIGYNLFHVKEMDDLKMVAPLTMMSSTTATATAIATTTATATRSCLTIVPFFTISNVAGTGIELLLRHLYQTKASSSKQMLAPFYAHIDETFSVAGVPGTIVSLIVTSGKFDLRQQPYLWLGPQSDGSFKKVKVKSIHYNRTNIDTCSTGQAVTFCLQKVPRTRHLKDMCLIDGAQDEPKGSSRYIAEITIVGRHSTTIKTNYEPIVNVNNIRQSVIIKSILIAPPSSSKDGLLTTVATPMTSSTTTSVTATTSSATTTAPLTEVCLRHGDTATVEIEFKHRPVYIKEGSLLLFRDHKVKGFGVIKNKLPPNLMMTSVATATATALPS